MFIKVYEEFWPFSKSDKDKNMERLKSIPKIILYCIKESDTGFKFSKVDVGFSKSDSSKFIIDLFNTNLNFKIRLVFKLDSNSNRLLKIESYYLTSDDKIKLHSVRKSGTESYNREFKKMEYLKDVIVKCLKEKSIMI